MIRIIGSIDDVMLDKVLDGLDEASKREPVEVLLCSEGGDDALGLAIASSLRQHPSGYKVHVIGQCNSAAVAILVAANYRSIDSKASVMYHASELKLEGNAMTIHKEVQHQMKVEVMWAEFLEKYSKIKSPKWIKLAEKDTYFSAAEALEAGLVDEIKHVL